MVLLSLRQRNLRRNCRPNTENTISPPHASQKIARRPKWHHSTRNQSARPALPRSCTATNICPSQWRKTHFQHTPESSGQKKGPCGQRHTIRRHLARPTRWHRFRRLARFLAGSRPRPGPHFGEYFLKKIRPKCELDDFLRR